jgi:CelD/BcsL family acetyltransferase involved in cellulose biosynthesis
MLLAGGIIMQKAFGKSDMMPDLIDQETHPGWADFVERHPLGWLVHLAEWKRVLESSFSHIRGYCLALTDEPSGAIRAALPVFAVSSWLTGSRLVSIPFATLSDPLVSSAEDLQQLLDGAVALAGKLRAPRLEVRTFRATELMPQGHFERGEVFKHHYLTLDKEPEQLFQTFHRTSVRQRIRRAEKSGLSVHRGTSLQDLREFYRLHVLTRRRIGLPPQPFAFIRNAWNTFSPSGKFQLLLATREGQAIAALIILRWKDRTSAEWGCSDDTYFDLSPNHILFWEAIQAARRDGHRVFDFGRTSPDNIPLLDFKRHWGTVETDLPSYVHPQGQAQGHRHSSSPAHRLLRWVCRNAPNFVCRCMGRMLYAHMG